MTNQAPIPPLPPSPEKNIWRVAYWHPTADGPDQRPFVLVSDKRAYCEGFFAGIQDSGPGRLASGSYVLLVNPAGEIVHQLDPVPLEPTPVLIPSAPVAESSNDPPYQHFGYDYAGGGGNAVSFQEAWDSCMRVANGKPDQSLKISHDEDFIAHVERVRVLGQVYYLNVPVKYNCMSYSSHETKPILKVAEITAQDGKLCLSTSA